MGGWRRSVHLFGALCAVVLCTVVFPAASSAGATTPAVVDAATPDPLDRGLPSPFGLVLVDLADETRTPAAGLATPWALPAFFPADGGQKKQNPRGCSFPPSASPLCLIPPYTPLLTLYEWMASLTSSCFLDVITGASMAAKKVWCNPGLLLGRGARKEKKGGAVKSRATTFVKCKEGGFTDSSVKQWAIERIGSSGGSGGVAHTLVCARLSDRAALHVPRASNRRRHPASEVVGVLALL